MTFTGDVVMVKGEQFKVVGVGPPSTDKKFWGRRRFTLRNMETDEIWFSFGTRIQHNSSLIKKNG